MGIPGGALVAGEGPVEGLGARRRAAAPRCSPSRRRRRRGDAEKQGVNAETESPNLRPTQLVANAAKAGERWTGEAVGFRGNGCGRRRKQRMGGAGRGAECEIENLTGSPCVVEGKCQSGKPIEPPVLIGSL